MVGLEDMGSRAGEGTRITVIAITSQATANTKATDKALAKATARAMATQTTAATDKASARAMATPATQATEALSILGACPALQALHLLAAEPLQDQRLALPALLHL